jgi:hypothetical protein
MGLSDTDCEPSSNEFGVEADEPPDTQITVIAIFVDDVVVKSMDLPVSPGTARARSRRSQSSTKRSRLRRRRVGNCASLPTSSGCRVRPNRASTLRAYALRVGCCPASHAP